MAKRLFPVPSPLLGDEEYLLVSFCIPDTPGWRRLVVGHIESLTYGRAYDEQTGYIKDAQNVGREIFASMSMCNLQDMLRNQRMLVAAIVGEAVDLTDPAQLAPDAVDFTDTGLVPTIKDMLNVDRSLYADLNIAEVLFEGLVGRRVSVPIPFEGTGLADIADEQMDVLHNRFRMTDSSIFNPLTDEKNITEAMETLLRRDKITDLEFLTPNIVTVLEALFQVKNSTFLTLLSGLYEWITGDPLVELPEEATTAEILMLIANAIEQSSTEPQPIEITQTTNVTCNCGGSGCGGCGGSEPPSEPAGEGDPPPTGWEPPSDSDGTEIVPGEPAYQSRKCKMANIVHQNIVAMVQGLKNSNVDAMISGGLTGAARFIVMTTIIGAVLGELSTPVPIADLLLGAAVGFVSGVVLALLGNSFDFDALLIILNDNAEDLVCELYNSSESQAAQTGYIQIVSNAGASAGNLAVLQSILWFDLLNALYYNPEGYANDLNAQLDGYTGPVDCGVCGCTFTTLLGTEDSVIGDTYTWSSAFGNLGANPDNNWLQVELGGCCRRLTNIQLSGYTPNTVTGLSQVWRRGCDGTEYFTPRFEQGSQIEPVSHLANQCVTGFNIIGDSPFTVTITLIDDCPPGGS